MNKNRSNQIEQTTINNNSSRRSGSATYIDWEPQPIYALTPLIANNVQTQREGKHSHTQTLTRVCGRAFAHHVCIEAFCIIYFPDGRKTHNYGLLFSSLKAINNDERVHINNKPWTWMEYTNLARAGHTTRWMMIPVSNSKREKKRPEIVEIWPMCVCARVCAQ